MDIVYSSSDSYCEIAGVSILSLLEHNRNVKELNLYLIDNQISAENKQKLEGMIASFGRTLTYLAHPDIEKRSATEINVGRWNISTFYRLFLPSMLPETVKKVLFIDCDTLVMQDLTPLWEMDMGDKWLYGVDDCRGCHRQCCHCSRSAGRRIPGRCMAHLFQRSGWCRFWFRRNGLRPYRR